MPFNLRDLSLHLESIAPEACAEPWDNTGLLMTPPRPGMHPSRWDARPIAHITLTIDLTDAVLAEAMALGTDAIIAYHPPVFTGLKRYNPDSPSARILLAAAAAGIAFLSPHTALDAVPGGVADWLIGLVGVSDGAVPITAQPMRPNTGSGRMGALQASTELQILIARIKKALALPSLRVAPAPSARPIKTVAVCPGSGGSLFESLITPVDLLVTGEMRHHDVLRYNAMDTSVILTEHTNCERGFLPRLAERLSALMPPHVEVAIATADRDPLTSV